MKESEREDEAAQASRTRFDDGWHAYHRLWDRARSSEANYTLLRPVHADFADPCAVSSRAFLLF